MKNFMSDDFLLEGKTAQILFDKYSKNVPIFDFHCHLNPKEIYEDKRFSNLAAAWLGGDHYKWRLMREAGIEEEYITGNAPDYDKFVKYASVLPYAIGNPIYHWTHLELRRFFDIDLVLSEKTADEIWQKANKKLENLSARQMIKMSGVKALCTTDDPIDTLEYHKKLKEENFDVKVLPTFRPDKAIHIELASFRPWIKSLEQVTGKEIGCLSDLLAALVERIDFFDKCGCVCSDHDLRDVNIMQSTQGDATMIFKMALNSAPLTNEQIAKYKGFLLMFLGREYNKRGWVQQYHMGALRNNSSRQFGKLGADTGFDSIGDTPFAANLSALLNSLDNTNELPKTILYCLNPNGNEVLAAIRNCFCSPSVPAKVQFGSAWWFNDHIDGMRSQLDTLAQTGLLSKFVGMLTDSRSFLSYPRHEYFRRILCNKLGTLIENGEYPNDIEFVGKIVEDICYNNAIKFFAKK